MSTKFDLGALASKLIVAAATGAIVGGGTMVLHTAQANAVQDNRLDTIEKQLPDLGAAVSDLNKTVQQLDKNVAVLNERMKRE